MFKNDLRRMVGEQASRCGTTGGDLGGTAVACSFCRKCLTRHHIGNDNVLASDPSGLSRSFGSGPPRCGMRMCSVVLWLRVGELSPASNVRHCRAGSSRSETTGNRFPSSYCFLAVLVGCPWVRNASITYKPRYGAKLVASPRLFPRAVNTPDSRGSRFCICVVVFGPLLQTICVWFVQRCEPASRPRVAKYLPAAQISRLLPGHPRGGGAYQ